MCKFGKRHMFIYSVHDNNQSSVCFDAVSWVVLEAGLENGFEKTLKTSKVQNLGFFRFFYFLVKFYTNHIKFHIIIVICVFCYILQKNALKESELCIGCSSWVEILCPVLFVH